MVRNVHRATDGVAGQKEGRSGRYRGQTLTGSRWPSGPGRSHADRSCHCRRRSSILSEVSTRARSKLPSGKNILVFGEQPGTALGRQGGSGGAPPTGSTFSSTLTACLWLAGQDSIRAAGEPPSPRVS